MVIVTKKTSSTRHTTTSAAWRGYRVASRGSRTPASIDEYLARLPEAMRASLIRLRTAIRAAAPTATEGISYQIPMFKQDGRPLVSFGAAANHCAFYVMSPAVMQAHASALKGYEVGKGSIRFKPDEPLPSALVSRLVRARIAETAGGPRAYGGRAKTSPATRPRPPKEATT